MDNFQNLNFQVLLDAIGLLQGVTLGILLIILNRHQNRSTFYLGLFLLFFSLELAVFISINPEISERFPELFLLPFNFSWLLFPLFFIYTQQVSILSKKNTKYWVLYPGIAMLLFQAYIYFLPFETKHVIADSKWYSFICWELGNYYSWTIGLWNLRLLYRHRIEVQNTYSYITYKELQWARIFLIFLLTNSVISHILIYGFTENFYHKIFFSVMDLIAIYWVSYFGILQRNVRSLLNSTWDGDILQKKPLERKPVANIHAKKLAELMIIIEGHMMNTENFTNPELTIIDLAEGINEHPKLVSTVINTQANKNFNTYVNQFRIEKAEKLLNNKSMENLSIEGIGKEVGFQSKSAFYSAFKKKTGTTPMRFIERNERN